MAQIASEDYENLRIYLHVDTSTQRFNPALMQREHRARRRLNASGERKFDPMVSFGGNESIGGGKFTATLVKLRAGVRIVPYDTPSQLDILNQIVNIDDGLSDRSVFDRSGVASSVDIDSTYSPVEIREVAGNAADLASAVRVELTPELEDIPVTLDHARAANSQTQGIP